jgi:hypothetical protein
MFNATQGKRMFFNAENPAKRTPTYTFCVQILQFILTLEQVVYITTTVLYRANRITVCVPVIRLALNAVLQP